MRKVAEKQRKMINSRKILRKIEKKTEKNIENLEKITKSFRKNEKIIEKKDKLIESRWFDNKDKNNKDLFNKDKNPKSVLILDKNTSSSIRPERSKEIEHWIGTRWTKQKTRGIGLWGFLDFDA